MRISVLLFAFFCIACDPWFPTEFPVDVHVDEELTQIQKDRSAQAIREWNAAVGKKVLNLRRDPEQVYRHTFHITNSMLSERLSSRGIGAAATDPFKCTIHLGKTEHLSTIEHELGHCLGLRHNTNPYSVMYPTIAMGQYITEDMIVKVLEIME